MNRFRQKLARMRAQCDTRDDFILVDARDADMAGGMSAFCRPGQGMMTKAEFLADIQNVVSHDLVDMVLVSVSTHEDLLASHLTTLRDIQLAVRANDSSDLWRIRAGTYESQKSLPFRTATLDQALCHFGLYSLTFNGEASHDVMVLDQFRAFRREARETGFEYFLEVFNPNQTDIDPGDFGDFLNDMITRCLAGMRRDEMPHLLKIPFNTTESLSSLCRFDPRMVIGIMGGGSGTTRDCLELLGQAQQAGARAALFGRKILHAEDPVLMLGMMRSVTDGVLTPAQAVEFYHQGLAERGMTPRLCVRDDCEITETRLSR